MANYANCKPVRNIRFSSQGKAALNKIGRQLSDAQIGSILLMSSTFHGIFTRASSTLEIAVNVGTSD